MCVCVCVSEIMLFFVHNIVMCIVLRFMCIVLRFEPSVRRLINVHYYYYYYYYYYLFVSFIYVSIFFLGQLYLQSTGKSKHGMGMNGNDIIYTFVICREV